MTSLLDHGTLMKNKNLITESAGGQAVTDVDRSLIPGDLVEAGINFRLRDRVQSRRGLVEDDKGRILVKCPGNGNFLGLPA